MREIKFRDKFGRFLSGHPKLGGFQKGSKHTIQAKHKVSLSLIGKKEELSRRWKGNNAGYVAIHVWLKNKLGKPYKCSNPNCNSTKITRFEWASISRQCKRDIDDWIQLCPSCHRIYDINKLNLGELYEQQNL